MPPVSRIIAFGGGGYYTRTISISSIQYNYNLNTAMLSLGWDGVAPVKAYLNVTDTISSTSTSTYSLTISGFPASSQIYLSVGASAYVVGRGGNGGGVWSNPTNGEPGGPALYIRNTTIITNLGIIGGGGGGGGGGYSRYTAGAQYTGGGGGGGGRGVSNGGIGVQYAGWTPGQNGAAGSIVAAGTGGAGGVEAIYDGEDPPNLIDYLVAGTGGAGGTWGTAGAAGGVGNYLLSQSGGVGGSGGIAIDGVSYVTFATIGTVSGSQIN